MTIISTPAELTPTVLNKAVGRSYKELQDYASQADHELALRPAFQRLLAEMARKINLTLVHEMTIRGRIRPDGVLCNAFHIQRGYWEGKGPKGNLEDEIRQKIKDGYPLETPSLRIPVRRCCTRQVSATTLICRFRPTPRLSSNAF